MVGVILIVAITIILGAVLATFVLSLGEGVQESAPSATFEYTYSDKSNSVTVTMESGDPIDGNLLRFGDAATEKTKFGGIPEWANKKVTAGDTATVEVESAETLILVWQGNRSENTAILSEYEVPNDPPATASIGSVNTDYTANDGSACLYNVQFSNAYAGNVYIVAEAKNEPSISESTVVTTDGADVKFTKLNPGNNFGNGQDLIVTIYETQSKNNELYRVTSEGKNKNGSCSI